MSTSASRVERERRYPFLVTVDLLLYWLLCAAILGVALSLVWVIVLNTSPHLPTQFWHFLLKIKG